MPRCYLSQTFYASLLRQRPKKRLVHYQDTDLPGFLLEHRSTGTGTWYYRYTDGEGKSRFLRMGSMREMPPLEARALAYEIYKVVRSGGNPQKVPCVPGRMPTLGNFISGYYLPHARLKKRSWDADRRMLRRHVLPAFGDEKLDQIRRVDVLRWQTSLRERGFAPCTCNRVLSLLKCVFNCAVRWELLDSARNPCRHVTPIPDHTARERFLTRKEARSLIAALDAMPSHLLALALKLLLFTGARKSEILAARWEHVCLERRFLTVPLSKSGKARHIPLSDQAVAIIEALPRNDSPWLFPGRRGGHVADLFKFWNALRQRLGLEDVRIHDLRHSFASFLVNSGRSLYEVQKILGHYDPKVTMRYAHLAQQSLVEAANVVEKSVEEDTERR